MNYDPWRGVVSRNGIPGDELISGLQKSIRRGNADIAIDLAYEMYITSEQLEDKLWRRLMAISVEDIGFGNVEASRVVYTLNCIRKEFPYDDGDRPLVFHVCHPFSVCVREGAQHRLYQEPCHEKI